MRFRAKGMTQRNRWHAVAVAGILFLSATPSLAGIAMSFPQPSGSAADDADLTRPLIRIANDAEPLKPDIDLYALMSGTCRILKVAGRTFACRTVAYFHSETGRAHFTVALEDPADESHVIAFSGENAKRSQENLYELSVDRMLLNSRDRPKVDGLPVPFTELSAGVCRQAGNFAARQVTSIACSATDKNGRKYELLFESDGSPIALRRIRLSPPTIRQDPYR
jgi:hypothetical protein